MKIIVSTVLCFCVSIILSVCFGEGVTIYSGSYIVGEDIPTGKYMVIAEDSVSAKFEVWGAAVEDYETNGGQLQSYWMYEEGDKIVGNAILEEGYVVNIDTAMTFKPSQPVGFSESHIQEVFRGNYIVGEDIPAGAYSIYIDSSSYGRIELWGAAVNDYETNGGQLLSIPVGHDGNTEIGCIHLSEGNILCVDCPMIFSTEHELMVYDEDSYRITAGQYIIGEDIPDGTYSATEEESRYGRIELWGAAVNDYQTNGGHLQAIDLGQDNNDELGRLHLNYGNILSLDAPIILSKSGSLSLSEKRTIDIPKGQYIIGEDIPAGIYSVSLNGSDTGWFYIWGAAVNDYETNGGLIKNILMEPDCNSELGRIILEEGNVLAIECPMKLSEYSGISLSNSDSNEIPAGRYIVGEDIPAGDYTVSLEREGILGSAFFTVWGAEVNDYQTNGGQLISEQLIFNNSSTIGKVSLSEGNVVEFDFTLTFSVYRGISFD